MKSCQGLPVHAAGSDRAARWAPCRRLPVCTSVRTSNAFVERAEAAGEADDGVALLHEHQLAREEVFHVHQLVVAGDDRVGRLLEGEHDVEAHRVLAPGADGGRPP